MFKLFLMLVFVSFEFVSGMLVLVRTVFSPMLMVVNMLVHFMDMFVGVLMNVFMLMFVLMFVPVGLIPMGVLMFMDMGVFMGMQVFVFVFAFHS